MHHYLPAIGFKQINSRKKLSDLLQDVETSFTHHELIAADEEIDLCEFSKEYGAGIGIAVFGDLDMEEYFERQYYYPYFIGTGITSYEDIMVEKRIDRDAYIGICDDVKVGINLYFHLQNTMEYLRELQILGTSIRHSSVTLSALCNAGIVLLPVMKNEMQEKKQKQEVENRKLLVSAARTGDQQAIESLALDDIDIYSQVSQRLVKEDVFSIVDTYIMPNGIDDFWLKNLFADKDFTKADDVIKLACVGAVDHNKNMLSVARALDLLKNKGNKVSLSIAGKIKDQNIYECLMKFDFVKYMGVLPKEKLIDVYRANDVFALTSFNESFGMVYIEAMSQGLPVIYTKDEGFDGQFDYGTVGYSVLPDDVTDISDKIYKCYLNREKFNSVYTQTRRFSWSIISEKYKSVYDSVKV